MLSRNSVLFSFDDAGSAEGRALLHRVGGGEADLPVVITFDGTVRDVADLDAAFGEEFEVAVGQSVAQAPAHRHHDHLGREPESAARRTVMGTAGLSSCILHQSRLPDDPISPRRRALPLMADVRDG